MITGHEQLTHDHKPGAEPMSQPDEIEDSPSDVFVAELKYWRDVRGFSQSALARAVGYGPSYVSKVENGQQRPSSTFACRLSITRTLKGPSRSVSPGSACTACAAGSP